MLHLTSCERAADEWQPIETAPMRKIILLFAVTDIVDGEVKNWKMATGCCDHYGEWIWDGLAVRSYETQPTHWMPLPKAPA
jgi:hypothetical protein